MQDTPDDIVYPADDQVAPVDGQATLADVQPVQAPPQAAPLPDVAPADIVYPEAPGTWQSLANSAERGARAFYRDWQDLPGQVQGMELAADLQRRIAAGEDSLWTQRFIDNPELLETFRRQYAENVATSAPVVAEQNRLISALPQHPAAEAMQRAETWSEAWDHFASAPLSVIANIGLESLVRQSPSLAVGAVAAAAGGVPALMASIGLGSAHTEYMGGIFDALTEAGVDITNADALRQALSNPELMERIRHQSAVKAGVVGAVDAVSGGLASRVLLPAKTLAARPVARHLTNIGVQIPTQGAMGGAGEALGSVASGQEVRPGAVMGEIVGEAFGAPAEVLGARHARGRTATEPPPQDQVPPAAQPSPAQDQVPPVPPQEPAQPQAAISGFYAPAERAIETSRRVQGPAQAWFNDLKKAGVSNDELDWMGFPQWMEENRGRPVSREEMAEFIRENGANLVEVRQDGASQTETAEHPWGQVDTPTQQVQFRNNFPSGVTNPRNFLVQMPGLHYPPQHFDGSTVSFIRVADVAGPNGERTLLIHGNQSQLHQAAEKRGYTGQTDFDRAEAAFASLPSDVQASILEMQHQNIGYDQISEQMGLAAKFPAQDDIMRRVDVESVPNAPLKGDRWWQLGLKLALRQAVAEGYDAVAISTADQVKATDGNAPKSLYDSKMPSWLGKYVKPMGGVVEQSPTGATKEKLYRTLDDAVAAYPRGSIVEKIPDEPSAWTVHAPGRRTIFGRSAGELIGTILGSADGFRVNALDQSVASALRTTEPETRPIVRITPQMRESISKGQPLFSTHNSPTSKDARESTLNAVHEGGTADAPIRVADGILNDIRSGLPSRYLQMVPTDYEVGSLITLEYVGDGHPNGEVNAVFLTMNDTYTSMRLPLDAIDSLGALHISPGYTDSGVGGLFFLRFDLPGEFSKRLAGELRHEAGHALRSSGKLRGKVWQRLLGHAHSLSSMGMSVRDYLFVKGDAYWQSAPESQTVNKAYTRIYEGRPDFQEVMDQEHVMIMLELHHHGYFSDEQMAPIRDILDAMESGAVARGEGVASSAEPAMAIAGVRGHHEIRTPADLGFDVRPFAQIAAEQDEIERTLKSVDNLLPPDLLQDARRGNYNLDSLLRLLRMDLDVARTMTGANERIASIQSQIDALSTPQMRAAMNAANAARRRDRVLDREAEISSLAESLVQAASEPPSPPSAPMTVYHGTHREFRSYSPEAARSIDGSAAQNIGTDIVFVSANRRFAETFGPVKRLRLESANLFDPLDSRHLAQIAPFINTLENAPMIWRKLASSGIPEDLWGVIESPELISELRRLGYDGAVMTERILGDEKATNAVTMAIWTPGKLTYEDSQGGLMFAIGGGAPLSLVSFIRAQGGIRDEHGELATILDRPGSKGYIPGIINNKTGIHPDRMRERLVQAGYLRESGPDQPAITSVNDVYDLVRRSYGGERVLPIVEYAEPVATRPDAAEIINQAVNVLKDAGIDYYLTEAEEARVVELVSSGVSIEDAIERATMESVNGYESGGREEAGAVGRRDQTESEGRAEGEYREELPGDESAWNAGAGEGRATEGTEAGAVGGFQTARGSTYVFYEDGTTTRNKAARPDVGHEGDSGPKPRSEKTVYVTNENGQRLGAPDGVQWRVIDHGDGTLSLATMRPDGKWGISPDQRNFVYETVPRIGLEPVELWKKETVYGRDAYRTVHLGNAITQLSNNQTASAAPESSGTGLVPVTPPPIPPSSGGRSGMVPPGGGRGGRRPPPGGGPSSPSGGVPALPSPLLGLPDSRFKRMATKLEETLRDSEVRVRKLMEKAEKTTGRKQADDANPYQRMTLYPGRTQEKITQGYDEIKQLTADMKALADELGTSISGVHYRVNFYLHAQHTPERNRVHGDLASGMETEYALKAIAAAKRLPWFDKLKNIADRWERINRRTLTLLADARVISATTFGTLSNTYKHNVPLNRIMEDTDDIGAVLGGRGFNVAGTGIKRAKGSDKEVADILTSIVTNYEQAVLRSEKNIVDLASLAFMREHLQYMGGQVEITAPKVIGTKDKMPVYESSNDKTILKLREDGKPVWIKFKDPALAMAFSGTNREQPSKIALLRYAGAFSRTYAQLHTRFNPEFALPNKLRDLQETMIYVAAQKDLGAAAAKDVLKHDPQSQKDVIDFYRGLDTEGTRLYQELKDLGGTTGGFALSTREQVEIKLSHLEKLATSVTRRSIAKVAESFDAWNGIQEDSTRLSVYKAALARGLTKDQAATHAKEASINFNRFGTVGPTVNALFIFANASVQGTWKMMRAMRDPKVAGSVAMLVALAVAAATEWNDWIDPEWRQKITKWDRQNNLNIMLPRPINGVHYIKIPVAWGVKPMMVMANYAYDTARGVHYTLGEMSWEMMTAILQAYNPLGGTNPLQAVVPTVLDTAVDIYSNQRWSGAPIRPTTDRNAPRDVQYYSTLKDTAGGRAAIAFTQGLREYTGISWSPADVHYAVEQYAGGVGRFLLRTANFGIGVATGAVPPARELPFLSRFYNHLSDEEIGRSATRGPAERARAALEDDRRRHFQIRDQADDVFRTMQGMTAQQAEQHYNEILDNNRPLARELARIIEFKNAALTATERRIMQMDVNDGTRARYLVDNVLQGLTGEDLDNKIAELRAKRVVTSQVAQQIYSIVDTGAPTDPRNRRFRPPDWTRWQQPSAGSRPAAPPSDIVYPPQNDIVYPQ